MCKMDSVRGVRNGRETIGSNSREVAFSIRADFRGDRILSELMFPAVSGEAGELPPMAEPLAVEPLAAEPPMAAAEPLSLFLWVCFEGHLSVAESDMICRRGERIV